MTAITERKPAPSTSTPDTIPTANLTAVLAAFNAANLASNYIERGNFTAARRKLVQALASIGQLQAGADHEQHYPHRPPPGRGRRIVRSPAPGTGRAGEGD